MRKLRARVMQRYWQLRHYYTDLQMSRAQRADLQATVNQLQLQLKQWQLGWHPGHFYSPIPELADIKQREAAIFDLFPRTLPGIDLNEKEQLCLLEQFAPYYGTQPFADRKQPTLRYFFDNPNYSYGEAIVLYCMMSHLRPKKIIEIGSGYSSCVTLDTNEQMFHGAVECTFIEPYPELLTSLLKPEERKNVHIIPAMVQNVDLSMFSALESGDILFVDSSHVSKVGSDVNTIFFEILPRLAPGVYVHFHDVCFPFEYPKEWIYQGRAWNEAYLLRAFLQYNRSFRIMFFNSFLAQFYGDTLATVMPLFMKNPGSSLWIQKQDNSS